jgi:hypothetical protein
MAAHKQVPRVSPKLIIETLLHNLQESSLQMYSCRIVPSAYRIFLAQSDYSALEPINTRILADIEAALNDCLKHLNSATLFERVTFRRPRRYERADNRWHVEILVDPDQEADPGSCIVRSELALPLASPAKAGTPTRFTTTHSNRSTSVSSETHPDPSADAIKSYRPAIHNVAIGRVVAELKYRDTDGYRTFQMQQAEVLIVLGDPPAYGDLRLLAPGHADMAFLIRMDPRTGMLLLRNRSVQSLSIDGRSIDPNIEVLLASRATIRIGTHTTLEFSASI